VWQREFVLLNYGSVRRTHLSETLGYLLNDVSAVPRDGLHYGLRIISLLQGVIQFVEDATLFTMQ
jgi:hypothetical protein